jgi:hypothetical protein
MKIDGQVPGVTGLLAQSNGQWNIASELYKVYALPG